jgi:hypothetical protein
MFINNSSIIEICIQWPELPKKDGDILYVHPNNLGDFANSIDNIHVRFVLVSCGSDYSIPFGLFEESKKILYSDNVICWFSQNVMKSFLKLRYLPIGIDYHTTKTKSKEEQEQLLIEAKKIDAIKKNKIYGNFHFQMDIMFKHDREEALAQIPSDLIDYEESRIPKAECYNKMASYKFIASPFGNGLECHRTWEALALGCIPIVKTSCMDKLYEGLPVLIVNSWSDVSNELLESYVYTPQLERLYVDYWINEIRQVAKSGLHVVKEDINNALQTSYTFNNDYVYSDDDTTLLANEQS